MRKNTLLNNVPLKTAVLLLTSLLLVACAPTFPPADPERAAKLRTEGLRFNLQHDFAAAAERYQQATLYDPGNSNGWLNLTELQAAIDQPEAAYAAYQQALKALPANDENREFFVYRSALLLAWRLDRPDQAERRLTQLRSPELKSDLTGVIALNRGEPRQALIHFQQALRHNMDKDRYARIYFHIAQAYDRLGDEDQSRDALLISVEKAQSRALKEDIRRFFENLLSR